MQCLEFLKSSERWMEGERDAVAAAHLKSCAPCRALVADLEAISVSAPALAEAEPPARMWNALHKQLEAEGLVSLPEAVSACADFSVRWMEGERDAIAAAHLKSCAPCRSLVADLETISVSASALAEAEPPARMWAALRTQLQAEGLISLQVQPASACAAFLQFSERWMEGERDGVAAAHLQSCTNCSALVADLEAISVSAPALAEVEPPARVWVSLRNQLEVAGLVQEPAEAAAAVQAEPRPSLFFGLRPVLATALLAVLVLFSGFYANQGGEISRSTGSPRTLAQGPSDGREVLKELEAFAPLAAAALPEVHEHDPLVRAAYKQNLQIIDNAIAMCEKTVKQDPRNEAAADYLRAAYQQKADLLASISQRDAMGD